MKKTMDIKRKELDAMLSVAAVERCPMPEGLAARVAAAGTEGFTPWGGRQQRGDLLRRCLAAAVVAVLLCSCVPATAPEAVKTSMIVNDGTDRAQILQSVHQTLEHIV